MSKVMRGILIIGGIVGRGGPGRAPRSRSLRPVLQKDSLPPPVVSNATITLCRNKEFIVCFLGCSEWALQRRPPRSHI